MVAILVIALIAAVVVLVGALLSMRIVTMPIEPQGIITRESKAVGSLSMVAPDAPVKGSSGSAVPA